MGLGSEYLPAMPVYYEYAAAVLACGAYYVLFGVLHELAHLGAARLLGCRGCLTWRNARDACCSRSVTVAGASGWRRGVIRHAAWVASVALAIAAGPGWRTARRAAAAATAAEALASDRTTATGRGRRATAARVPWTAATRARREATRPLPCSGARP